MMQQQPLYQPLIVRSQITKEESTSSLRRIAKVSTKQMELTDRSAFLTLLTFKQICEPNDLSSPVIEG